MSDPDPTVGDPDPAGSEEFPPAELDEVTRREFLLQAGLLNLGILAGGAGLVLLGFTDRRNSGLGLVTLGALFVFLAAWRYRRYAPSA